MLNRLYQNNFGYDTHTYKKKSYTDKQNAFFCRNNGSHAAESIYTADEFADAPLLNTGSDCSKNAYRCKIGEVARTRVAIMGDPMPRKCSLRPH